MVSLVEGVQVNLKVCGERENTGKYMGGSSSREGAMDSIGKKLGETTPNSGDVFVMSYEYL